MKQKAPAGMPEWLREMIENDTFKDQPKEFQDRIIKALDTIATGTVPPDVQEVVTIGIREQKRNLEIAKGANLLCDRIGGYIVRGWEV